MTPKNDDLEQDKPFIGKKDIADESKHNHSYAVTKIHQSSNESKLNHTSEIMC